MLEYCLVYDMLCAFFQALKEDMCRSLLFRCQLLCEDLLQSEEEQGNRY